MIKIKFLISLLIFLCFTINAYSNYADKTKKSKKSDIRYRTSFGKCPSRAAGTLTLELMKAFERHKSLKDVKMKIVREKLNSKHFLSEYQVDYNPLKKVINFKFECPAPLMKVQIYKNDGIESYDAILVENGKLYDPTYEVLLRNEGKLKKNLPFLAIPVGEMEKDTQVQMSQLIGNMGDKFRKKLSEVILNKDKELTIILSLKGRPSSVFLGTDNWDEKVLKLRKIVEYMEEKKKIPAIINLTNSKKVVVKFNDKF